MKNVIFAIFAVAMLASCSNTSESVSVDSLAVDTTVVESVDTTVSSEEINAELN
jgi:ABC-type phosphate/phosphonate transport system substrate-binding protein